MPYKLKLNLPNVPEGVTVTVIGLGDFENGKEYSISDSLATQFRVVNATLEAVPGAEPDKEGRIERKHVPGPTLVQAFKNHPHITVVSVTTPKPAEGGADK